METAETVEMKTDRLKGELSKIRFRLEELDDVALSIDDLPVEHDLRSISSQIRRSLDRMEGDLEPDEPWLLGDLLGKKGSLKRRNTNMDLQHGG